MKLITAPNGVLYYSSPMLRCPHGFSTRIGGVSSLPHTSSLNLAFGRGDDEQTVLENLKHFCIAVGIDEKSIVSASQIHSSKVVTLTSADCGKGYFTPAGFECDGYVTMDATVSPAVKTADCVPILLAAENHCGKVFAVAALHAGWRGTAANIVSEGLRRLYSLGAEPGRIFAAIGPCIGSCCFEVDPDCRNSIVDRLGGFASEYIFHKGDKYYPDLTSINLRLLTENGISPENIDTCGICTGCHPELFYSHRKSGGQRGTMLSVIKLP